MTEVQGGGPIGHGARTLIRPIAFWLSGLVVLSLDQTTKLAARALIDHGDPWPSSEWHVRLINHTNTGAAFGILEGQTAFLVVMSSVGLAAIYLYYRNPPFDHWLAPLGIGMILGGALSNLLDRIRMGGVTDMLDVYRWPTFNVADSGITVGVGILILGYAAFSNKSLQREGVLPEQGADCGQQGADVKGVSN